MIPRFWLAPFAAALALALAPAAGASTAPSFDLAAYKGKVVYLDFWASWCAPCRQSFPWMENVQSAYGPKGVVVVAVNVDHDRAAAERFLEDHAANFDVVYDPKGQIASKFKVSGMPMTVLIDRDGKVRFSHVGFYEQKEDAYASQINQLVAERAR